MTAFGCLSELFGHFQIYLTNFPIKLLILKFFCEKPTDKIQVLDALEASDQFFMFWKVDPQAILYMNRP